MQFSLWANFMIFTKWKLSSRRGMSVLVIASEWHSLLLTTFIVPVFSQLRDIVVNTRFWPWGLKRPRTLLGPMKGVIPTHDIAKNLHQTPDIKGKKCLTPDTQNSPRHSTPLFQKINFTRVKDGGPKLTVTTESKTNLGLVIIPSRHSTLCFYNSTPETVI